MSDSDGHIIWREWIFDFDVLGTEGLCLLNGFFAGRRVFGKLSLPVIRVKYTIDEQSLPNVSQNPITGQGCGPYNDQITWDTENFGEDLNFVAGPHHLVRIKNCNDRYICIKESIVDSEEVLELGVYARIGAYHIYQAWYLQSTNEKGTIRPQVWSKGLSCNLNHWHHPYWRFDFNLDGREHHRVHFFDGSKRLAFVGFEGGFQNTTFAPSSGVLTNPLWSVENIQTGSAVWIIQPKINPAEGIVGPNWFSQYDVFIKKYREDEDVSWPFAPEHEMNYSKYDFVDDEDVVFWSIGHLLHHAEEGKDHWHGIGPTLKFVPARIEQLPHQRRKVHVSGIMHMKDYRVGKDKWSHPSFDESVVVEPNSPHREIRVTKTVGDIEVDFILKFDWQFDSSVHVDIIATLYDEGDDVANEYPQFNVLRESAVPGKIHLRDWHVTDPDTADIDFKVENSQA